MLLLGYFKITGQTWAYNGRTHCQTYLRNQCCQSQILEDLTKNVIIAPTITLYYQENVGLRNKRGCFLASAQIVRISIFQNLNLHCFAIFSAIESIILKYVCNGRWTSVVEDFVQH